LIINWFELRLTPEERKLMDMRSKNLPYAHIAETLFSGKRSRQAVQRLEGRVKRKLWIAESAMRYKDNLSDCSIEEAPLPAPTISRLIRRRTTRTPQRLASPDRSLLNQQSGGDGDVSAIPFAPGMERAFFRVGRLVNRQ
jgi:hypothetical protein